jgi:hypothetical protein|tara:strand:- start:128 stop:445 length:318 start_codon:yes stop_codon:yes gene_type:complete
LLLPLAEYIYELKFEEEPNYGKIKFLLAKILLDIDKIPDMAFDWNPDRVSTIHYNAILNNANPSVGLMGEYDEEREDIPDGELDEPKIKLISSQYRLYPKVVNFK